MIDRVDNWEEHFHQDLETIVRYLWRDEFKDWEELDNPNNHIFHAINNVRNYLEGRKLEHNKEKNDDEIQVQ